MTVEVFSENEDGKTLVDQVLKELILMEILEANTKVLYSNTVFVNPGWPTITPDFLLNAESALEKAKGVARNVKFVGRGNNTNSHFMGEVLETVYQSLS